MKISHDITWYYVIWRHITWYLWRYHVIWRHSTWYLQRYHVIWRHITWYLWRYHVISHDIYEDITWYHIISIHWGLITSMVQEELKDIYEDITSYNMISMKITHDIVWYLWRYHVISCDITWYYRIPEDKTGNFFHSPLNLWGQL